MGKIFFYVYSRKLNTIFLWMILGIVLWNIVQLKIRKILPQLWKLINRTISLCAVFLVLYITLGDRTLETKEVCLIPFQSFVRAKIQPEIYRSMLMNVFLFFPLGLTMPYVLPEKWRHNALLTIIFACIFSIAIEYLQYYFQLGRAETDDVICNTLGCFIGTISYMLSRTYEKRKNSKEE